MRSTVRRAISRFGRYRQSELLASLDEATRLAVNAVGMGRLLDVDPENRVATNKLMQDFRQEYAVQVARLGGQTAD